MKDLTPILWIAGLGIVAWYGYQQGWFGILTVGAPAAIPPVTPAGGGANIVPIGVLTPIEPTPIISPPVVNPVPPVQPPQLIASPIIASPYPIAIAMGGGCPGCM